MTNGETLQLGGFVTLIRGTTYKGELVGKPGPALLGLGSIEPGGGFRVGNYKTYGGDCPEKLMLAPGDLYVSLKGATKDGEMIGSVARVPPEVCTGRLTQDTVKLEFASGDTHFRHYLYWLLRTPQYRAYCAGHATGSAVVALSRKDFLSYPVPPLTLSRRRLVDLLEACERKIELNRRMNETLDAMARAIFRDWFVDFGPTRAKQDGREPYLAPEIWSLFPDRLDDEGKPEGWGVETLYEQAIWVNGAAYKDMHFSVEPDALPVVKIAELKNGITSTTRFTNSDLGERYRIGDGELLFSWSGNPDTSIDTFLWTNGDAWLNQHIFAVRSNGKRTQAFLYAMLKLLRSEFAEIARNKQTTGLGHVTQKDLIRLKITAPSEDIQTAFEKIAEPIHARLINNLFEIRSLIETRDLLLPKLMSGEIRVRDAEKFVSETV